jgi:excisionase family DNA binding protein
LADAVRVLGETLGTPPRPREEPWITRARQAGWEIAEDLGYTPLTPDIDFVAYLRALARFGFFVFGPITIDVRVVEDLLYRTHPRGPGGGTHQPISEEMVRFNNVLWADVRRSGRRTLDELHYLLAFMRWPAGLPSRVFGELGVTGADVERYVASLSAGEPSAAPGAERLYSTEEAAEYYGVHVQTVRTWIRSGKLPAAKLAGQKYIRIREGDLKAVLERITPGELPDD